MSKLPFICWLERGAPVLLAGFLAFVSTGCVLLYAPGASAPGRYVPPMNEGDGDFGVDLSLGRNVAYGVEVGADSQPAADDSQPPFWPGIDLAFRYGLTDDVGIDARITTSLILPLPFPIPNGLTVAPIFSLLEDPEHGIALHISPRALWINGAYLVSGPSTNDDSRIRSFGAEVPVMFTYSPIEWFDLSGTAFIRGFYNLGRREDTSSSGTVSATAGWPTFGGGLTVAAILTAGRFRVSIGLGIEAVPNAAANLTDSGGNPSTDGPVVLIPQGGLTLGAAWDIPRAGAGSRDDPGLSTAP